ncbi:DUF192 domain-containing protein [Aureisphaera sp. CAU 1614]|uniref:DUF192 domain-containing protein n=1 Tax=Halomarinibacterium sedimenti TaxID=2857106 RepID=A0A9X1FQ09_9FLAO|nr:DUF192 domain-containing protein [Halomarinibacterium sedimenti]MBW2938665.1 DUF192 domain-containing protein [Halomarinibacterium sedimenti]
MKRRIISILVLASLLQAYSCKDTSENKVLTKEITFKKEGELILKKAENDSVLATLEIEISETEYETQTGLMYRKSMEQNRGMLFIFEREARKSFYMKNTEFPLDIIYVNSDLKVVSIQKNTKPFDESSIPSQVPAKYALEVNAGLSDQWGLEVGDIISFNRD